MAILILIIATVAHGQKLSVMTFVNLPGGASDAQFVGHAPRGTLPICALPAGAAFRTGCLLGIESIITRWA